MKLALANQVLLVFCCLALSPTDLLANSAPNESMGKRLVEAERHLNAFNNDSANIVLTELVVELENKKQLDSPFGIEVQLRLAEAIEKDDQDEIAIQKLLGLIKIAEKNKQWSALIETHLSLARLYEKINRPEQCLEHLRHSRNLIKRKNVDQLYPRFAVRISSYHRIYDNRDSSIFYAEEVLRTAPIYEEHNHEAVGHMLLGMLKSQDYKKSVELFQKAGNTFTAIGDFAGASYIHNNLMRLHFENQAFDLALAESNLTIKAAQKAIKNGHEDDHAISGAYKYRGNIYHQLGQSDSAWTYINKAHKMEMENIASINHSKVVEIDARYNDELKEQQIKEQQLIIQKEQERKSKIIAFVLLILCFSGILFYYYLRLKKANELTLQQADQISKTNEELSFSLEQQIMLQGEVHHRVKNNLQVIVSLLELQKEDIEDENAKASLDTMANRIYSMAAIHEILYQKKGDELVNLLDYARNLCNHFKSFSEAQKQPIFQIDIDEKYFNLATLMPLGIILNELLTNSLKYAGSITEQLKINLSLTNDEDGFCLSYRDNGPGFPAGVIVEREGGLGTYLLKSMSRQLSGRLETINDRGAVSHIYFKEKNNF